MTQPLCRWGILGTAHIARKNWKAIRHAGNSSLTAVASRDRSRAQAFIDDCLSQVPLNPSPFPCGSYEELLDRRDVDAVYIPLPTGIRKDWVVRAAQAGKHVLCEKPCGVNAGEVRAMLDACREHGVQFMDGVMFMHSQRLDLMRQVLADEQSLGTVLRTTSQFSFRAPEDFLTTNIRASSALEPLGCLGDLGWYNVRLSLCAMNEQVPERVTGRLLAHHDRGDGLPVPMEFSAELFFRGGATASFYCSFLAENQQWAIVSGTRGYLHVPDFVVPFFGSEVGFEVNAPAFRPLGCDFNMESHPRRCAVHEYSNGMPGAQETNMIRTFARIVLTGQLEPRWGVQALATQQVIDACLRSARADGNPLDVTS